MTLARSFVCDVQLLCETLSHLDNDHIRCGTDVTLLAGPVDLLTNSPMDTALIKWLSLPVSSTSSHASVHLRCSLSGRDVI